MAPLATGACTPSTRGAKAAAGTKEREGTYGSNRDGRGSDRDGHRGPDGGPIMADAQRAVDLHRLDDAAHILSCGATHLARRAGETQMAHSAPFPHPLRMLLLTCRLL